MKKITKILLIVCMTGLGVQPIQAQVTESVTLDNIGWLTISKEIVDDETDYVYLPDSNTHIGRHALNPSGNEFTYRTIIFLNSDTFSPITTLQDTVTITEVKVIYEDAGSAYTLDIVHLDDGLSDPADEQEDWEIIKEGSDISGGDLDYGGDNFTSDELKDILQDIIDASNPDLPVYLGIYSNDEDEDDSFLQFSEFKLEITYERQGEPISATARNDFHGNDGGNIGIGIDTSASSYPSPKPFTANEGQTLNLAAYDGFNGFGYDWVFNDTEAPAKKSEWEWRKGQETDEFGVGNQTPSRSVVADDNDATFAAIHRSIYTITRNDYSPETDNTFNTANVQVVEGNTLTAPTTQTVYGTTYMFFEWSDGVKAKTRTINSPTSSLTAHYKGSQLSDKSNTWKAPQRKVARTENGWEHMVYESMGHIWYEAKAPSGDWELMPFHNRMHLDENGGTSPSISFNKSYPAFWPDMVAMVWQENSNIKLQTFYYSQSGGDYSPGPYQSISSGSRPNVVFTENEELIVIYRTTSGLAYTLYNFNHDEGGPLDEITSGTISGTSGASNVAVSSFTSGTHSWFDIVYEQSMDISGPPYFHGTEIRHTALRYIRDETSVTQVVAPHVISSGSIVRNKEPSIVSISPATKIVGWISATTDNSTWDPWQTRATIATLNWDIHGLTITRSNIDHHVRSVSVGKLSDNSEFYSAWSQIYDQSGWIDYNKFVEGTAWYTFKSLSTKGWDVQLAEANVAANMHALSYYPKTKPYHWLQSNSLGSSLKQRPFAVSQSRGIVLSDSAATTGFYFGIEDFMADDVPVVFKEIEQPTIEGNEFINMDRFPIGRQTLQDVEPWLTSEPFQLKKDANYTFSESFSYGDSVKAHRLLGKKGYITFSATLVDDATGQVIETLREFTIDGKQGFSRSNKPWKIKGNTLEGSRERVEITAETNLTDLQAVIENGYTDDYTLGKRSEQYFEDLEFGESEEIDTYALGQNYPNPFNPTTQISYQLPQESMVRLEVYDLLGRRVQMLVNDRQKTGRHQVTFDASSLASGVYIYRLQAGDFVQSRKLFLIK